MTEEVQALAEVDSAPTTDATAAPEVAESTPEVAENQVDQATEEKKYSQAEIDAMIGKRLAREQRGRSPSSPWQGWPVTASGPPRASA